MDCQTVEQLRPFQSTRDLDGARFDREVVQDIAYDGEPAGRTKRSTRIRPAPPVIIQGGKS
jgi:hypothetical protein